MHSFKDNAGRTWAVSVTVDTIKRVRALVNVDLLNVFDGKLVAQLASDPVLLCDALYAVLKPEADAQKVSDVDFGRAMAGDAIEHATTALLDELADFSRNAAQRQVTHKALAKMRAVEARALVLMEQRVDALGVDQVIETALRNAGASSGSSPASPESTPAN